MVLRRKQVRGRPLKDPSPESPPPRRAKAVANANIAAQFMFDSDEPSAKIFKLDPDETFRELKHDPDIKVKEETDTSSSGQNSDACAICLGTRLDPTELDNCIHSFCYTCTSQWFKYSEKCPLCMVLTKTFAHNLNSPNGRETVSVSELHSAAEAARLAERGQSQPPLDEHECIRLRIRRLQRRLSTLQNDMSRNTRDDRKEEFQSANSRLVNEISRLEMLRRDATTRIDLVSDVVFRSLIYKDNLDWSSIDRNANRVAFSPAVFKANVTDSTNRLHAFLSRELPIVWRSRRPRESREAYVKNRDVVMSDIITWCGEYQINSPQFSRNLRTAGIYPNYLQRFQSELFEFASSMLGLRDFDSTSTYSSPEVRRMLERRNRRGGNSEEVVTVSDSDDSDGAIIPLDVVQSRSGRHRSRRDDDIIVLSDDNLSDREALVGRGESIYVRDETASSNSEASNAGDFYTRPACRLPRSEVPASSRDPLRAIDAFGVLREIYAGFPSSRFHAFSLDSMANDLPFIFPRIGNQDHQYSRNSRSRSPIERVDNTIVLSSEDESNDAIMGTRRRLRNMSIRREDRGEASSSSQDTIPASTISWLNPANSNSGPTSFAHFTHSSPQYVQSSPKRTTSHYEPPSSSHLMSNSVPPRYRPGSPTYEPSRKHNPPVTPQSSPRPLENLPSTSNAEQTGECRKQSQNETNPHISDAEQKKRPKSLFQPSTRKYIPNAETEIRAENKLLAKLFHERQLRNGQAKLQNAQTTTEDRMDMTVGDAAVENTEQDANRCKSHDGKVVDMTEKHVNDATSSKNLEAVDVPSQSVGVSEDALAATRTRGRTDESHSKRHRKLSWNYLFKRFRKKMKRERSTRKRERLYEFVMDMKQELEKVRADRNYRGKSGERSRKRSRDSSKRRDDRKREYRRRHSSSDSEMSQRQQNDEDDVEEEKSRSRSPSAASIVSSLRVHHISSERTASSAGSSKRD